MPEQRRQRQRQADPAGAERPALHRLLRPPLGKELGEELRAGPREAGFGPAARDSQHLQIASSERMSLQHSRTVPPPQWGGISPRSPDRSASPPAASTWHRWASAAP